MHDKLTDAQLVERTLRGDMSAYGILVDRYRSLVYGLACHLVRNFHDAEDIAQEAFIKAYDSLSTLKDKANFSRWLRTIALNLCKMWLRKSVGQEEYLDSSFGGSTPEHLCRVDPMWSAETLPTSCIA